MQYKISLLHSFLGLLLFLILRKVLIAFVVMHYVRHHIREVDMARITSSPNFTSITDWMKSNTDSGRENYVFMLNRHALNMTMNWLCSTQHLEGVHESSLFVTMDDYSSQAINEHWPEIHVLPLNIKPLQNAFNYGDGPYQLFYLLRANLARAFLKENVTFWMTQQDTYWRSPLSSVDISHLSEADVIFDRASDANVTFIAGGYYRAQPTEGARAFFDELSRDLSWWYAPDNAYMSSLCRRRSATTNCGYLHYDVIPNWKWLYDHPEAGLDALPPLMQFDGETQLGGKLETMRKLGFYYLSSAKEKNLCSNNPSLYKANNKKFSLSLARFQFCVYQAIVDGMYAFPPTSLLLDYVILPSAHFFMITM